MKHPIHHVRHQARKHHEAHLTLKQMLKRPLYREKIWHIFLGTFTFVLATFIIFVSWGKIVDFFTPAPTVELPKVHGFQSGTLGTYKIDKQVSKEYKEYIAQIKSGGFLVGMSMSQITGNAPEPKPETEVKTPEKNPDTPIETEDKSETHLNTSIWVTNQLGSGQHLTKMNQKTAMGLQKSILTTFYLGEKTVDINSTLQNDTLILKQINNVLSIDLFQYLNQSNDRAGTLDSYLNLLITLKEKTDRRVNELGSKISFLQTNSNAQETRIKTSEEEFFRQLQLLNGPNAEEELSNFVGIKEDNAEVRAKMGAYKALQSYYTFFQPRLDNLIRAIKANRDALIAGVKVTEIENMTLPIIIKEK